MRVSLRPMSLADYPEVLALWRRTGGMGLGESDEAPALARFFDQNPDLSPVALAPDGRIVGAVLCGHDGRRGFLYHLAVDVAHRERGVGRLLVEHCLFSLRARGIHKCNVFLFRDNERGADFWQHNGWSEREDLRVFQRVLG
jgi:ribosomal protein S18 acetylase RimI-like enzyme